MYEKLDAEEAIKKIEMAINLLDDNKHLIERKIKKDRVCDIPMSRLQNELRVVRRLLNDVSNINKTRLEND